MLEMKNTSLIFGRIKTMVLGELMEYGHQTNHDVHISHSLAVSNRMPPPKCHLNYSNVATLWYYDSPNMLEIKNTSLICGRNKTLATGFSKIANFKIRDLIFYQK